MAFQNIKWHKKIAAMLRLARCVDQSRSINALTRRPSGRKNPRRWALMARQKNKR